MLPPAQRWSEPEGEQAAPGIECKLLATDTEGTGSAWWYALHPARYPAHTHAGVEELHLLDGELWIDERKLCRATTITGRLERTTSASGARRTHLRPRRQRQGCPSLKRFGRAMHLYSDHSGAPVVGM